MRGRGSITTYRQCPRLHDTWLARGIKILRSAFLKHDGRPEGLSGGGDLVNNDSLASSWQAGSREVENVLYVDMAHNVLGIKRPGKRF